MTTPPSRLGPFARRGGAVLLAVAMMMPATRPLRAEAASVCGGIQVAWPGRAALVDSFGDAAAVDSFLSSAVEMVGAIDQACTGDPALAEQLRAQVSRVEPRMAAGAAEPTPYLPEAGTLVIEHAGGPFVPADLVTQIRSRLAGEPPVHDN